MFGPRPRKPLVGLAMSALVGIAVADFVRLPIAILFFAGLAAALAALVFPRRWLGWIAALLTFALLHTTRHVENPARIFGSGLERPRPTSVEGVVWSEPTVFDSGRGPSGGTFWLKVDRIDPIAPVAGQLCLARWEGAAPAYGDRVRMRGSVEPIDAPKNPGQFDIGRWLARRGVHFAVVANSGRECEIVGHDQGEMLRHFAIRARVWIKERLDFGLPPDPATSSLISSMLLGMRGETPPDLKELFQKTGTLHLFAVSGLNIGMLAVIALYVLKPFGIGRRSGVFVIVPFLITYGVVVGMSASCARATFVGVFFFLASLWEREAVPLNSMAGAALAILAVDTNELFNPGFQLSFALVLVIVGFSKRIQTPMERWAQPDEFLPRRLWSWKHRAGMTVAATVAGTLAVGIASWLGSMPFMWGYFHLLSPIALIANIVAVPLAFLILGFGIMSIATGVISASAICTIVNHANWQCAQWLVGWVGWTAQFSSGHHYVEWPEMNRDRICEVVALDAGEGAAIHVRAGDLDWLIDSAHRRDYPRFVLPYLRSRGVDRLDGLFLTHGDTAHVGGAMELIEDLHPRWIGDCAGLDRSGTHRVFHAELVKRSIGRRFFQRGDVVPLGEGVSARVLYPPADHSPQNVADDKALVLRVEANGFRILLTSDIGFSAENWLLKHEADLCADILIKGWADRDFSGTPDFISAIRPQAVVFSAPRFGTSETGEWAERLKRRGITMISQAEHGAARIAVDRNGEAQLWVWKRPKTK